MSRKKQIRHTGQVAFGGVAGRPEPGVAGCRPESLIAD